MRARRHRHEHVPRPLSRHHRAWLYALGGVLLGSGIAWLICHYGLREPDAELPHPAEPWWLRLHGAAMIGFLVSFGAILPGHVKHGWRYRLNTVSGVTVTAATVALSVTGYGLYYLADERLRTFTSLTHSALGLAGAGVLVWHVITGHRLRAARLASGSTGSRRHHQHSNKIS